MFEIWQNFGIKDANDLSVDIWAAMFTEDETLETIAEYKNTTLSKKK